MWLQRDLGQSQCLVHTMSVLKFLPIILKLPLFKCQEMVIQLHIFVLDSVPDDWWKIISGTRTVKVLRSCFKSSIDPPTVITHLCWLKIQSSFICVRENPPEEIRQGKLQAPVQTNGDRWHISPQVRFVLMGDPRRWRSPLTQTPAGDCLHLGPVKVINDDRSGHTVNSVEPVWWIAGSRCGLSQSW